MNPEELINMAGGNEGAAESEDPKTDMGCPPEIKDYIATASKEGLQELMELASTKLAEIEAPGAEDTVSIDDMPKG